MLTRRGFLLSSITASMLSPLQRAGAAAPQPMTPVRFPVPAGACDCHTHVFGDPERFPFSASRMYTPPPALPEEMARLHQALRVQRVVIVTASAYGTDNSATLYGVEARYPDARGIVVIDAMTPDHVLDRRGVCGVRLYLAARGMSLDTARQRFVMSVERVRQHDGLHIQLFAPPTLISALKDLVLESPVPVVFDHFGGARGALGISQPGFEDLLRLLESGKAYVKLSAAYRFSDRHPDLNDMAPLAHALIAANPDRVLWATDWPHTAGDLPGKKPTDIFPFMDIDDGHLMNLFAQWVPNEALRQRILVDNPARLYAF